MSQYKTPVLEADSSALETNLRFVKNEFEEDFQEFIEQEKAKKIQNAPFKMVTPKPGMCVKTYKVGSQEKFFINICHTNEIPAPKDITATELHELLEKCEVTTSFKVPLSITSPREALDKSNKKVQVSDIAINTSFFKKKVEPTGLFFDFVITLIFESLETKFKILIDSERYVILKNRPYIDKLVEHQIYSRDVKTVERYHAGETDEKLADSDEMDSDDKIAIALGSNNKKKPGKSLIEELPSTQQKIKEYSGNPIKKEKLNGKMPEYRLIEDFDSDKRKFLVAEFYLPGVAYLEEIDLEINDDRICLENRKLGIQFDGFLKSFINPDLAKAEFDYEKMILKVHMPVAVK